MHLQSVPPNPATAEYVLLSGVHGTLPRTDHMLDHKTYLKKFKSTEITQSMFSDYNRIILETNHRRKFGEFTNIYKFNSIHLYNQLIQRNHKQNQNILCAE